MYLKKNQSIIKVVSFDLDDTLYNNDYIIKRSEQAVITYLTNQFQIAGHSFNAHEMIALKKRLIKNEPIKYENLTLLRKKTLSLFCEKLLNTKMVVEEAMNIFFKQRHNVMLSKEMFACLEALSERYTLVSVSNGNASLKMLSIASFFTHSYSPQKGYRAKPHPEMLQSVLNHFNISPMELLHIGDNILFDGMAAKNVGCHYLHIAPFIRQGVEKVSIKKIKTLLLY
jgi:putative hydrolase of the HAD superfamily